MSNATPHKRGITTVADIRDRCKVDPATHCWQWTGAASDGNQPRMHAFCHRVGEKRTMSGPEAVWNIAHGESPAGWLVYRTCCNVGGLCLNPAHLKRARNREEGGRIIRSSGRLKGVRTEAQIQSTRETMLKRGIKTLPDATVLAIRAQPAGRMNIDIAREFGVAETVSSRIRLGRSYRHLLPVGAQP